MNDGERLAFQCGRYRQALEQIRDADNLDEVKRLVGIALKSADFDSEDQFQGACEECGVSGVELHAFDDQSFGLTELLCNRCAENRGLHWVTG